MKKLIIAIAASAMCIGAASAVDESKFKPIEINSTVTLAIPTIGCVSLDDYKKVTDFLLVKNDEEAAGKYAIAHCKHLPNDQPYKLDEAAVWSSAVCLRKPGDTACYWAARALLTGNYRAAAQ